MAENDTRHRKKKRMFSSSPNSEDKENPRMESLEQNMLLDLEESATPFYVEYPDNADLKVADVSEEREESGNSTSELIPLERKPRSGFRRWFYVTQFSSQSWCELQLHFSF